MGSGEGQGRSMERSGGPREVPELSQRGFRNDNVFFVGDEFADGLMKYGHVRNGVIL